MTEGGINPELRDQLTGLHLKCEQVLASQRDVEAVGNLALGRFNLVAGQATPEQFIEETDSIEDATNYADAYNGALTERIKRNVRFTQARLIYEGETELPSWDFVYRRIGPRPGRPGYVEAVRLQEGEEVPVTVTTIGRDVGDDHEGLGLIAQGEQLLTANATRIPMVSERFVNACSRVFGSNHLIQELFTIEFDPEELAVILLDLRAQAVAAIDPPEVTRAKLALLDQLPQHIIGNDPFIRVDQSLTDNFTAFVNSLEDTPSQS